ncbi:DUF6233 domain-containing protein [Streptomyces sp. NPDC059524]|uniref:DUF6233 domain-containing protein n=1 Tax=Streptomyces sp. NPDC059524 TaxID=3346856 RepID=UPI0036AABB51
MNDQSPEERLAKHRAVEAWLEYQLRETRRTIAELEKEAVEGERRRAVAYRERRYTLEQGDSEEQIGILHRGACEQYKGEDFFEAPQAAVLLRDRRAVPCDTCRPALGLRGTWIPSVDNDDSI